MRIRAASLLPLIGGAALLLGVVACSASEASDRLDADSPGSDNPTVEPAPNETPPDTVVSDPLPLDPDPDRPPTDTPVVEPGSPEPSDPALSPPPEDVVEQLAPIVAVDLAVAESYPPQYFVSITSAQPDGCNRFSRYELTREGTAIEISVWNTVPRNLAVVLCLAVYGETETNVALGSDFEPGQIYTIAVNGEQYHSFVAR